ncbi:transcriptional regulator NrdR, partial [Acinetobacter baumannii]|uniref:ATP cone domain-containing protein n=1 Tax=Acinetobacter baumannii TaxID=470 RepID=UPI001F54E079
AISRICHHLRATGEREVPAREVGEYVMESLQQLDDVAYVRFASVYRSFQDIAEFAAEVDRLRKAAGKDVGKGKGSSKSRRKAPA